MKFLMGMIFGYIIAQPGVAEAIKQFIKGFAAAL
jgi:hypothetical protein